MTELELCQLSQSALIAKLKKVDRLSRTRLLKLNKSKDYISELELEIKRYQRKLMAQAKEQDNAQAQPCQPV